MILSAYPTIGKTTLANKRLDIIDLESSCFDKSNPNWYIDYCRTALDLEKQGYTVFVSSHKPVQDYMKTNAKHYVMIMYSPELKDYVIRKCEARYNDTKLEKDLRAMERIKDCFSSDIQALLDDNQLCRYVIYKENYNLEDIVDKVIDSKILTESNIDENSELKNFGKKR